MSFARRVSGAIKKDSKRRKCLGHCELFYRKKNATGQSSFWNASKKCRGDIKRAFSKEQSPPYPTPLPLTALPAVAKRQVWTFGQKSGAAVHRNFFLDHARVPVVNITEQAQTITAWKTPAASYDIQQNGSGIILASNQYNFVRRSSFVHKRVSESSWLLDYRI